MAKAKTLKKREVSSIKDMPIVKLKKGVKTKKHDPTKNLGDPEFITHALAQCLLEGDKVPKANVANCPARGQFL